MDEQQDYKFTGSQESDGKTLLKFERKFDTCDSRDKKLEVGATKVVFAYHSGDPVSTTDMKHHEFRGARTILLLNSMDKRNLNDTGWSKFNVTANNVTIPAKETTYWCSLLKGPALKSKHHITKIVPNIQKGNEGFVHHLILYECYGNFTEELFDQGVKCSTRANMPYLKCRWSAMVAAWAVGGEATYFPPHAGYPIGESDSPANFLLEMHYDNPKLIEDQQDNSGLTIYFTDNLRKYDVGIAAIGLDSSQWLVIPPKQKNWLSVGYCMHQCSESLLKSTDLAGGGIKVFGSGLHTHLAGRAVWTKHVRNGKELPEIARDDHYDFNFQDFQVLRKEITIRPGDDLIQYCKYDSTDRDQLIRGGLSTRQEMCLNFLFYYPRIKDFTFCTSNLPEPSLKLTDKYFHDVSISNYSGNPLVKMDITWTDEMANDLRKYESKVDTVIPGCWFYNINRTSYEDEKFKVPIPEITEPLPAENTCPISSGAVTPTSCVVFVGVLGVLINVFITPILKSLVILAM